MKKHIIISIAIAVLVILNTPACKRSSATDPGTIGPTGHSITLSGSATPSTLYMPGKVTARLTVAATKYDGSAASNRDIVLEGGALGYFTNNKLSVQMNTGDNGVVGIDYIVPRGSDVRVTTTIYITATLIDEQNPGDTSIYCYIPIEVIPYEYNNYICISGTITDANNSRAINEVVVELSTGEVDITKSGKYSIVIPGGVTQGWFGEITPVKTGYNFNPSSITIGTEETKIYSDATGVNFYGTQAQSLKSDYTSMDFGYGGGYVEFYIFGSPDPKYKIKFNANTGDVGWVEVSLSRYGTYQGHLSSTTPKYLWVRVGSNAGNDESRSTAIVIVATDPPNISGSPMSITINQDADPNA